MGLDMVLYATHKKLQTNNDQTPEALELMYWRKANAIHSYFVEMVQRGVDDCSTYQVTVDELRELLRLCKMAKENPEDAGAWLPTEAGFFFGSTDYDEYYFHMVDKTIDKLEEILDNQSVNDYNYYYNSSW